jgi:hypothetical protein
MSCPRFVSAVSVPKLAMWGAECSLILEDPERVNAPPSPLRYPFDSTGAIPYLLASSRRKRQIVVGSIISAFSLFLVPYLLLSLPFARYPFTGLSIRVSQDKNDSAPLWDRKSVLLGPPTERFRGRSAPLQDAFTSFILT